MYRKFKKMVLGLLAHATPSIFFSRILRSVALVDNSYFFRTAVLRKLFDIRFSYKHCNFSRVCLLVKMTSKTVTRSIGFGTWKVRCLNQSRSKVAPKSNFPAGLGEENGSLSLQRRVSRCARGPRLETEPKRTAEPFQFEMWFRHQTFYVLNSMY